MNRSQKWVFACGALALVLALVACQSGGESGNAAPAAATTATTVVAAATAQPSAMPLLPTATRRIAALPTPQAVQARPSDTPTPIVEPTRPPLGDAARPVQLLFPPVANSLVIAQRGSALAEALRAATGAEFTIGVVDSEAVVADLLCAAPEDVIGFVSAAAYTVAAERCDAQAGLVAIHEDGYTWQAGMLVIRPGAAESLADLDGRRWAVADTSSLSNYLYFRAQMVAAGIEPSEVVNPPEDTTALLALFNDEVAFTTADYTPPIMPRGGVWTYGEHDPEEWRLLGVAPSRSPIGYVIVAAEPELGGYRLRDARARLFDTTPEIFNATRILTLSEPIPNETVVLGADFPPELAERVMAALISFAASDACQMSLCSADFYGWTGLEPADDANYDPIRTIKDTLELEAADLWAELD
jgi:phosphonate transport system substrate-binding protein